MIDGMGTLVSLARPAPRLRHELAARFGIDVTDQEAGRALAAEIGFYRAHMGLGRDADSLGALRRRCAEVMREALPPSERLAGLEIGDVTEALLGALHFEAYPDARPALSALAGPGPAWWSSPTGTSHWPRFSSASDSRPSSTAS